MDNDNAPQTTHHKHPDELAVVKEFVEMHGMTILVAVCVVTAAATGLSVFRNRAARKDMEAVAQLSSARTIPELEALIGTHGETAGAQLATLRLAKAHYNAGSFDLALGKYDEFRAAFPNHPLVDIAVLGRLHCLEASGQTAEAAKGFAEFAAADADHYLLPEAVMGQARCLVQDQKLEDAKAVLEDYIAAHPDDPSKELADEQLESVVQRIRHRDSGITRLTVDPEPVMPAATPPVVTPSVVTPATPAVVTPNPATSNAVVVPAPTTPPVVLPPKPVKPSAGISARGTGLSTVLPFHRRPCPFSTCLVAS